MGDFDGCQTYWTLRKLFLHNMIPKNKNWTAIIINLCSVVGDLILVGLGFCFFTKR